MDYKYCIINTGLKYWIKNTGLQILYYKYCIENTGLQILYYKYWIKNTGLQFSILILQTLIEERRSAHRERWNKNREAYKFNKREVVIAHIQVQSKSDNGEVSKLSYGARGPFQIMKDLGSDSYHVKR